MKKVRNNQNYNTLGNISVIQNKKFNNFACWQEAECEKSAMDVKYATDTKIEDNARMYKLQKAQFDQEINTAVSYFIESGQNFD